MAAVISRKFSADLLNEMTIGMVLDVLAEYTPEEDRIYIAGQSDIEKYLG